MKIDLSLELTRDLFKKLGVIISDDEGIDRFGHVGTHLDLMGKDFDLSRTRSRGVIFDVRTIRNREIIAEDIDLSKIKAKDFVLFYTGCMEEYGYGNMEYFKLENPQLSQELIDELLAKKIRFIGADLGGIRKIADHPRIDHYCADHGVFVVENIARLGQLLEATKDKNFIIHTYPLALSDATGLPCRVIAEF
jgi:Predicted metal-dependent hydrolase